MKRREWKANGGARWHPRLSGSTGGLAMQQHPGCSRGTPRQSSHVRRSQPPQLRRHAQSVASRSQNRQLPFRRRPTTCNMTTYMVQRPLGRMTEGRSVRSVLLWHCQFTKNFGFDRELSMGTSSVSSCGCMKPRRQPSRQRLAAIKVHYLRCNQSSGREDQNECWILGRLAPAQARRAAPASIWHDFRGRWRQTSPR